MRAIEPSHRRVLFPGLCLVGLFALGGCSSSSPTNLCAGVTCSGHGVCALQWAVAVCVCDPGYHAVHLECVPDADSCQNVTCSGHGTCQVDLGAAVCVCDPGYVPTGLQCNPASNREFCEADGFCWHEPLPHGWKIRSLWAGSDGLVWMGGPPEYLVRWDGTTFASFPSTLVEVNDLWGFSPNDVWGVGSAGNTLHWDGPGQWTLRPTDTNRPFAAVWGCAPNDIWAAADSGILFHYDGSTWTQSTDRPGVSFKAMFGFDCSDIWAVGSDWGSGNPPLAHWDGAHWTQLDAAQVQVPSPERLSLTGIWGAAPDDIWAVGDWNGLVIHWDGTAWTAWSAPDELSAVRWFFSLWGRSATDVWAVGQSQQFQSALCHFDGGAWNCEERREPIMEVIRQTGDGPFLAAGGKGLVLERGAGTWEEVSSRLAGSAVLDMQGFGPDNLWAVGGSGLVLHWDSQAWTRRFPDMTATLMAFHGDPSLGYWAAGYTETGGIIVHWDESASGWTTELEIADPAIDLWGVWSAPNGETWAVGSEGTVVHRDPASGTWSQVGLPQPLTQDLHAVWGSSAQDVWAVGSNFGWQPDGVLLRWNGQEWSIDPAFAAAELMDVAGRAANDVYILGTQDNAVFLRHWDGTQWTAMVPDPSVIEGWYSYSRLSLPPDGGLYLSGGTYQTVHYAGGEWSRLLIGLDINSLWSDSERLWAAGWGILSRPF